MSLVLTLIAGPGAEARLPGRAAAIGATLSNGEPDWLAPGRACDFVLRGGDAAARIRLMPGARALLATLRAAGVRTALVSGGFTVFVERIAAELGFDRVAANRLDIADGHIAGTVASPILTRETKRDTLLQI